MTIKLLFDYHYGMFDKVWDSVSGMATEAFVAESDYSMRSVRNHLVHCMNVDDRWLARLRLQKPPDLLTPSNYPDQATVRSEWNVIRGRVLTYVGGLEDAELDESIQVALPSRYSTPRQSTRREVLHHMVNHGTDHRAQILARLHELGARTIEQDLVLYLWEKT